MEKAVRQFTRVMIGVSVGLFIVLVVWLALTDVVNPPYLNVGFTGSWVVACLGIWGCLKYAVRRSPGKSLSWGEAMTGATAVFALMFWIYGVVPHLWITFSDSELSWRESRALVGPMLPSWWAGGDQGLFEWALPFSLNYEIVRDSIAALIYVIALAGNVWIFLLWQKRGLPEPEEPEETSRYGRPLVQPAEQEAAVTGQPAGTGT